MIDPKALRMLLVKWETDSDALIFRNDIDGSNAVDRCAAELGQVIRANEAHTRWIPIEEGIPEPSGVKQWDLWYAGSAAYKPGCKLRTRLGGVDWIDEQGFVVGRPTHYRPHTPERGPE